MIRVAAQTFLALSLAWGQTVFAQATINWDPAGSTPSWQVEFNYNEHVTFLGGVPIQAKGCFGDTCASPGDVHGWDAPRAVLKGYAYASCGAGAYKSPRVDITATRDFTVSAESTWKICTGVDLQLDFNLGGPGVSDGSASVLLFPVVQGASPFGFQAGTSKSRCGPLIWNPATARPTESAPFTLSPDVVYHFNVKSHAEAMCKTARLHASATTLADGMKHIGPKKHQLYAELVLAADNCPALPPNSSSLGEAERAADELAACCLANGTCSEVTFAECLLSSGTLGKCDGCAGDDDSNGIDDACEGACCLSDGSCDDDYVEVSCVADGGVFHGPGVTCLGDSNGDGVDDSCLGACCITDEPCAVENTVDCLGTYLGDSTTCDLDPCGAVPYVACCLSSGACDSLPAVDCLSVNGFPGLPGTACLGDTDGNGVDEACQATASSIPAASAWGMLAMTLFVLAAGTLVLHHRRRGTAGGSVCAVDRDSHV